MASELDIECCANENARPLREWIVRYVVPLPQGRWIVRYVGSLPRGGWIVR